MTNEKLFTLFNGLSAIKNLKGVKFNYAIAKNLAKLEPELQAIKKTLEFSEKFKEFEDKRVELCKKYGKKNELGEDIMLNGTFDIEDKVAFKKELDTLKEENKETLDARTQQIKEYNELMEVENTIELFKIKMEDIPAEINTEQMVVITPLIEE